MDSERAGLTRAELIVVKVGSAVLSGEGGAATLAAIAAEVRELAGEGRRFVVVSSGAVACGLEAVGRSEAPRTIVEKQLAAALGQAVLVGRWSEALKPVAAAQVLLTADDFERRARYLNAHRTLAALLAAGHVPIVNENDSVAYEELRLGDNDRLSALVARGVDADALIVLSSAPGLEDADGAVVPTMRDLATAETLVRDDRTAVGTGGMSTKLEAAGIAGGAGIPVVIADGREPGVLGRVLRGETVGTLFPGGDRSSRGRRRWIGAAARVEGRLHVDGGAVDALQGHGASLLAVGITRVEGSFEAGAGVDVVGPGGEVVARGLASYPADDIRKIAGEPNDRIEPILGYLYGKAVVHRDDLVLIGRAGGSA